MTISIPRDQIPGAFYYYYIFFALKRSEPSKIAGMICCEGLNLVQILSQVWGAVIFSFIWFSFVYLKKHRNFISMLINGSDYGGTCSLFGCFAYLLRIVLYFFLIFFSAVLHSSSVAKTKLFCSFHEKTRKVHEEDVMELKKKQKGKRNCTERLRPVTKRRDQPAISGGLISHQLSLGRLPG